MGDFFANFWQDNKWRARKHHQQGSALLLQAVMWQECGQTKVQEKHKIVAASKETSLHEGVHSLVSEVRTTRPVTQVTKQRAL
jgi:hypothetical protein